MSSINYCIKFHLNIIFFDYFKKYINGKFHNIYLAELIQPACPYCHSTNLKHNYTGVVNAISSKYSNGYLEGVNRKIKQIERTAYGYSNFKHLLIRIRLEENIVKEKESNNYFSCLIP